MNIMIRLFAPTAGCVGRYEQCEVFSRGNETLRFEGYRMRLTAEDKYVAEGGKMMVRSNLLFIQEVIRD